MNHTPLYTAYKHSPGVKCIDFGGWELPVEFGAGIGAEHKAVREKAGLFDVSHMGEIKVSGNSAFSFLNNLLPGKLKDKKPGCCVYTPMCLPNGGTVDDLLVYIQSPESFLLVVNAANIDKDYKWITNENPLKRKDYPDLHIENMSSNYIQIALQGPLSVQVMEATLENAYDSHTFDSFAVEELEYYHFLEGTLLEAQAIISRTGYTGEDGYEIYLNTATSPAGPVAGIQMWDLLLSQIMAADGLPCGLGARDTLRLEARLPLYGHELSDTISPLESGLKRFIDFDKPFVGSETLLNQKSNGIPRCIKGIAMEDKGIPRDGYAVYKDGKAIGAVTSGTKSPTLGTFIGLILVETGSVKLDDIVEVDIHGKQKKAKIIPTPFYKKK